MNVVLFAVLSFVRFMPFAVSAAVVPPPSISRVYAKFDTVHGVYVGTPVFYLGKLVGGVSDIKQAKVRDAKQSSYELTLSLSSGIYKSLNAKSVALLSSPVVSPKRNPKVIVELMSVAQNSQRVNRPPLSSEVNRIRGFSSYEDYWRAGL